MMRKRIHVFGASGSGTTTIAKAVSGRLGFAHFDSDAYFWLPTEPPFTTERDRDECLRMMRRDLTAADSFVLSGSVAHWGDELIPLFELVVFVYVPPEIRVERLRKREFERYGDRILPGGDREEASKGFLDWAAAYDGTPKTGRSLEKHKKWLEQIKCPVLRIVNHDLEESIGAVVNGGWEIGMRK